MELFVALNGEFHFNSDVCKPYLRCITGLLLSLQKRFNFLKINLPMKELVEKIRIATVLICIVAGVFKLLHWPGANMLLIVGLGSLAMVHILLALDKTGKSRKEIRDHILSKQIQIKRN